MNSNNQSYQNETAARRGNEFPTPRWSKHWLGIHLAELVEGTKQLRSFFYDSMDEGTTVMKTAMWQVYKA